MDLNDYISAGYFITHHIDRPDHSDDALLPPKIISLSSDIANFFPNDWTLDWVKMDEKLREKKALAFGLKKSALKQTVDSLTSRFNQDFGYHNVCYSLETARSMVKEFSLDKIDLTIIGAGLHHSIKEKFIAEMMPPPPKEGYAPIGQVGILEIALKDEKLTHGAQILGFELMSFYSHCIGSSWLSYDLEREINEKLKIVPNKYGLIDNFEDALKSCEHITKNVVITEPGFWIPLLIAQYSLEKID